MKILVEVWKVIMFKMEQIYKYSLYKNRIRFLKKLDVERDI